jgi:2-keto-3-deoxy-L-fuconate dehydrogenase
MFRLDNKIAVITGGGSGIGRAISTLFASQGATVHILEQDAENAEKTVGEIRAAGNKAHAHVCDISIHEVVKKVFQKINGIDILVNNAGIANIGKADTTREEDFDKVVNVNIKGVYNCLHAAIAELRKKKGGVIINMASVAALSGIPDRFAYSTSKGAILAMTLSVAKDYIHENIRCNSISPARVHTPFVDGFLKKSYPGKEAEMFEKLSKTQPIGRMATPAEIAALALYLSSDEASFLTGCDYPIDGGFVKLNN